MNFSAKYAIPLSKSIILGGAIVSVIMSLLNSKPLLNYRIVSILQPMVLLGTIAGVSLNKSFPDWIILLLLASTLVFVVYKNITKALKLYKQETIDIKKSSIQKDDKESSPHLTHPIEEHSVNEIELVPISSIPDDMHQKLTNNEANKIPWVNIFLIGMTYVSIILFALLKGGSENDSILGIDQCSTGSIILTVVYDGDP